MPFSELRLLITPLKIFMYSLNTNRFGFVCLYHQPRNLVDHERITEINVTENQFIATNTQNEDTRKLIMCDFRQGRSRMDNQQIREPLGLRHRTKMKQLMEVMLVSLFKCQSFSSNRTKTQNKDETINASHAGIAIQMSVFFVKQD